MTNPRSGHVDFGMDGHVHTALCNHARGTMEEYVQAAIKRKLHTICFLEHLEVGIDSKRRSWLRPQDFEIYFQEGERLKQLYKGKITILLGVEAGYNPERPEATAKALAAFPWDRKGVSCHFLRIGGAHVNLLSRRPDGLEKIRVHGVRHVLRTYFTTLTEALRLIDFDVVCHLDAALRHYPGIRLSAREYELIDTILDIMQQRGITLEINTSGFGLRGAPFPDSTILRKAMARGIPLQPGSDAHAPDQVGRWFSQCEKMLQELQQDR